MDVVDTNSDRTEAQGERLSLAFANTADWHGSEKPVEYLTSYSELVAWSQSAGILNGPEAQHLLEEATHRSAEAAIVLDQAIILREAIYRIFSATSRGLSPEADDLAIFNRELSAALAQSRVSQSGDGFSWAWFAAGDALDGMIQPIVRDAADLLTSSVLARVGQCADDMCGWLFLDMSRNHSRKWCSMKDCGNRAKARRHYERSRIP